MPIKKSAKKDLKQNRKRRVLNLLRLNKMKAEIKKIRSAIGEGKKEEALKMLSGVYKAIDKSAKRGVIKKNAASRKKSRLTKSIAKIDVNK